MNNKNPYEGRWRWWYEGIADWMIEHPGGQLQECARDLNKTPTTISLIIHTDVFKDYLAKRRAEWRERHDHALTSKTTAVAEAALDCLLVQLEKKKDQVPITTITEIATSALDRLGYSPQKAQPPSVQVNVQQNNDTKVVHAAVSPLALEEAREALRVAERNRAERAQNLLETPKEEPVSETEEDTLAALFQH